MAGIFKSFLVTSCVGTALAFVLLLLRPVTKKIFSPGWHYYMWLAVLAIMVLPFAFELPAVPQEKMVVTTERVPVAEIEVVQNALPVYEQENVIQEVTDALIVPKEEHIMAAIDYKLFSYIWLVGIAVLMLFKVIGYMFFLIRVRLHSQLVDCPAVRQYSKRNITVRSCRFITSPLMVGICKPMILIPETKLTEEQLHYVLAHECTHLKRQDILYKWFLSFVKCVHWFNPIVYAMAKKIHLDCESSCDMAVVKNMTQAETKGYMETILALLTAEKTREISFTTGMSGEKKTLMNRFQAIKKKVNVSRKKLICAIVLAVVVIGGAFFISGMLNGKVRVSTENSVTLGTDARQEEAFNLLMIGVDANDHADTILVVNLNNDAVNVLSIPRNVNFVSGVHSGRMSALLAKENGDKLAIDAVRSLGIPIHYYAKVKMQAVEMLIDRIGGLSFDIPYDMVYDDPYQDLHIEFSKGLQWLNGEQVMNLLRYRDRSTGEESRRNMWFSVMEEFFTQVIAGNRLQNVEQLYGFLTEGIVTNYQLEDLLADVKKLQNIDADHITFQDIPGQNVVTEDGMFEYRIDMEKAKGLLQCFQFRTAESQLTKVNPSENNVKEMTTPQSVIKTQKRVHPVTKEEIITPIKSNERSEMPYGGFQLLTLENADIEKMQELLKRKGSVQAGQHAAKLSESYIVNDYSYENDLQYENTGISCDANGNISVYFAVNSDNLVDISFFDSETKENVGSYLVLANNKNAYSFLGFDRNKTYDINIQGKTQGTWQIDGQYIVY